jgi:hypothetical protein
LDSPCPPAADSSAFRSHGSGPPGSAGTLYVRGILQSRLSPVGHGFRPQDWRNSPGSPEVIDREEKLGIVFLAQLFSTLFMVGVIWFAQVVHYPLLGQVGNEVFGEYQNRNTRRTGWIVIPPMMIEPLTALLLLWNRPEGVPPLQTWLNVILLGVIWISTFSLQAPYHNRLSTKFDPAIHQSLVHTNWIRTITWSGKGLVLLWMLTSICSR